MTSPPSKHFDYVWHFSFHRVFQMIPPTTPLEHFAHSASLCNCYATWYPNRTVYSPDLLEVQNRELGICLLLKGTRRMASASSLLKLCRIKPLSHRLVSGSMMLATIKSLSTLWVGCSTLLEGWLGIHASLKTRIEALLPTLQHDPHWIIDLAVMILFQVKELVGELVASKKWHIGKYHALRHLKSKDS